jgi:hypothetical protein
VSCTDDAVAAYLKDGTIPQRTSGNHSDLQCPPVPQPDPSPALTFTMRSAGPSTAQAVEVVRKAITDANHVR